MLVEFIIFAAVMTITPGPNNTLVMVSGLRFGLVRTLPHMLGISLGFGFMLLIVGQVFPLLPEDLLAFIQIAAKALILYLGYKIATAPIAHTNEEAEKPWTFLQGAMFQWVNPKAIIAAFASLSAYEVSPLVGAIVFSAMTSVLVLWVLFGKVIGRLINGQPRLTRIVFVCLGATLAATIIL